LQTFVRLHEQGEHWQQKKAPISPGQWQGYGGPFAKKISFAIQLFKNVSFYCKLPAVRRLLAFPYALRFFLLCGVTDQVNCDNLLQRLSFR
jgi:hypothetical protein